MGRLIVEAAETLIGKYFPVHDHGFIALRNYMGGDLEIERFARGSYEISPKPRPVKETNNLIRMLKRSGHTSPFEAVELSFHVGTTIFSARQWIRHRTANINELSGRYTEIPSLYYSPTNEEVCYQSESNKQGSGEIVGIEAFIDFLRHHDEVVEQANNSYQHHLKNGVAREIARIDLPLSTYTYFNWKCDLHNLFHFLRLRCKPDAQRQIRDYADVIAGIVQQVCPLAYQAWYDYQFASENMSRMELGVLRSVMSRMTDDEIRQAIREQGVENVREQNEFIAKMKTRQTKSFDLDLSVAKSPEYFMDKIKNAISSS